MNGATAYLVAAIGCVIAVAGVVVAVLALRSRRKQAARPAERDPFRAADNDADALRGDPRQLRPGDVVEIRGSSYGVRGTLRFTEGSWGWSEHLLDDARGAKLWLSVEEDPDLELVLWTALPTPDEPVLPGGTRIEYDGQHYTLDESGRASYTAAGTTGLDPTGTVRYHDYLDGAGVRLSFSAYGSDTDWDMSRGELLTRAEVLIYGQAPAGPDDKPTGRAG
ncbi:uncharacterized protein DUF4178 [Micromonospora pisi]|uniref:Uncharacterized protein DUF4178 n=1 Tax=Micromonospora pisi TaxID=589240 RepID=A0A495JM54_9ACTN|nr:DUF4178 domain-containing protein [Micromonospora pisi]RKR89119.1 uncharacterized protein DUF4178 [Micromonospora pisi]